MEYQCHSYIYEHYTKEESDLAFSRAGERSGILYQVAKSATHYKGSFFSESITFFSLQFEVDVLAENEGAKQMKLAADSMENLPIFKNDEEKTQFEACIDVDLSQVHGAQAFIPLCSYIHIVTRSRLPHHVEECSTV